ncbi:hypothetical protein [Microbulbifer epialgicus]|uniref:Uncharacterized protein n=1 Tax=Microbulbifer epialgicus TaxID=393907 RepID=A0ABV4P5T7_9GAMM
MVVTFKIFRVVSCLCNTAYPKSDLFQIFVARYDPGSDKWVIVCLLTSYIEPKASLIVVGHGDVLTAGIKFDSLEFYLYRIDGQSALEVAQFVYDVDNPVIRKFMQFIRDIEVNFWGEFRVQEVQATETVFRFLQRNYARNAVLVDCYLIFLIVLFAQVVELSRAYQND